MGSILTKLTDGTHSTPHYTGSGIPFISVKDISSGNINFSNTKFISKAEHDDLYKRCDPKKGDMLLTKVGTTGIPVIVDTDVEFSLFVSVALLRYNRAYLSNNYMRLLILSPLVQKQCSENTRGVGNKNWVMRDIANTLICIPPYAEQKRIREHFLEYEPIISKYNIYYNKLETLNASVQDNIQKSILQYAIQGKLVPQNPNDEPASVLLERIREEKEQMIKDGKIKRDKNESYIYRGSDNSYYETQNSENMCIDDIIPFEIPNSWCWCRLENISQLIHYGFTSSAQLVGNAKLLRITDIQDNQVDWNSVPFCSTTDRELDSYKLKNRDILIARTGGTIGKTYIVTNLKENAVFASYLIRVVPVNTISENYIKVFMESPEYWTQLKEKSMGTGQPNVNGNALKKLLIPIPPLTEQINIVQQMTQYLKMLG